MISLSSLWLPILLAAVLVFVVSSVIHMASPWHKNDYPKLANEDRVMDALRPLAIPAGDYMIPRPTSRAELQSPEFMEKVKAGPMMVFTVLPSGPMNMGRNLGLWFAYTVVVGAFSAYVAALTLSPGAPFNRVVLVAGVTAFLGYAAALWQMSIWYRRSWSMTAKATVDGAIYAGLTALSIAWLWPH